MDIQKLLKEAKNMQKDLQSKQEELAEKTYVSKNDFIEVEMKGSREITSIKILGNNLDEDKDILEDMILLAFNDLNKQIVEDQENSMSKYTNMMPGIF